MDKNNANIVLLGSGCFWHPEMIFHRTDGVISTKVGYAGGTTENLPTQRFVQVKRAMLKL